LSAAPGLVARLGFDGARLLMRAARVSTHVALGALRREAFLALVRGEWEHYAEGNLERFAILWDWERDFYLGFLAPGGRTLLVGCGTGRDLAPLIEAGFRMEGLDLSPASIAICRDMLKRRGLDVPLHTGSIVDGAPAGPYEAIVFSWYAYGYVQGRGSRIAMLRGLARSLAAGGRILFSYVPNAPPLSRWPWRAARAVAALTRSDWQVEYGDFVEVSGGLARPLVFHYERRFTPAEIEAEAEESGLRVAFHAPAPSGRVVLER
jgi:SAM-dependent methyltransferase